MIAFHFVSFGTEARLVEEFWMVLTVWKILVFSLVE